MSDLVEVVSGVAMRNGRILLTQRPASKDFPLSWECPGGKVDGNESHHGALRREWQEEIGVEVGALPEQALWCGEFKSPVTRPDRGHIFLLFYFVGTQFTGNPSPREGQGIGWFTESEMRALTLSPGIARAIDEIVDVVFRRGGAR